MANPKPKPFGSPLVDLAGCLKVATKVASSSHQGCHWWIVLVVTKVATKVAAGSYLVDAVFVALICAIDTISCGCSFGLPYILYVAVVLREIDIYWLVGYPTIAVVGDSDYITHS